MEVSLKTHLLRNTSAYIKIWFIGNKKLGGFISMKEIKITVEFCMMWNYAPKAASLAEELFTHFRNTITSMELIPSSGGVFEISVNGENIYSKREVGKFPKADTIISTIEGM